MQMFGLLEIRSENASIVRKEADVGPADPKIVLAAGTMSNERCLQNDQFHIHNVLNQTYWELCPQLPWL